MVGRWIDNFPAPDYCGEMNINNNTIEIEDFLFEGSYKGTYTIENGFLVVLVTEQFVSFGDFFTNDNYYFGNIFSFSDRYGSIIYKTPIKLIFPISNLERFDYGDAFKVKIGYTTWFGEPR